MQRESPEEAFRSAQEAMEQGDWESFFTCLAPNDLKQLAGLGVGCVAAGDTSFRDLCLEHGASAAAIDLVRSTADDIVESANAMSRDPEQSAAAMLAQSLAHRDLVKAHEAAVVACTRELDDHAAFVAATERLRRATSGGGSVSSSLFVGETLSDVTVADTKAVGVRRYPNGEDEPVGFVRRRDGWRISIFSRPRL